MEEAWEVWGRGVEAGAGGAGEEEDEDFDCVSSARVVRLKVCALMWCMR